MDICQTQMLKNKTKGRKSTGFGGELCIFIRTTEEELCSLEIFAESKSVSYLNNLFFWSGKRSPHYFGAKLTMHFTWLWQHKACGFSAGSWGPFIQKPVDFMYIFEPVSIISSLCKQPATCALIFSSYRECVLCNCCFLEKKNDSSASLAAKIMLKIGLCLNVTACISRMEYNMIFSFNVPATSQLLSAGSLILEELQNIPTSLLPSCKIPDSAWSFTSPDTFGLVHVYLAKN